MKPPILGINMSELTGDCAEKFEKYYGSRKTFLEFNPGKVILPKSFYQISKEAYDIPVYEDDVWVCSYPRTGSTWAQEMVWLVGHDADFEKAKEMLQLRCPFLEMSGILLEHQEAWHNETISTNSVDMIKNNCPRPRYIRSHLPWDILPKDLTRDDGSIKAKVVYTIRNPKDMCVSYYHYNKLHFAFQGEFNEFCELYMEGNIPLGPVWNHVLGFNARRNDPNLLILKYEDMKNNFAHEIRRTADFLNKTLTDDQVTKICEYLSFENMKDNKAVNLEPILEKIMGEETAKANTNKFIRNGKIGDWRNHMSEEMSNKFDEWIRENAKGTELYYE